jgi:tRNA uracil 4-sulfurtransferase
MPSVIAHYQEIALKGKNRPWFLHRLIGNLRDLVDGLSVSEIRTPMGRIDIAFDRDDDWPELRSRLSCAFGLANFSLGHRVPVADVGAIGDAILRRLPDQHVESFRISVRRADKRFMPPSPEVERILGRRVQDAKGWRVDLARPAFVIWVEIVPGEAFIHFGKLPGPGGLPLGTSGRVVVLLSGGIDSPVAAWRMMRRGCYSTLVHFHSYPFLSRTSQDKARDLARLLTRFQLRTRLYLVPFGELQRQITLSVPGPLRVVVYRRMMFRIADRVADRVRAQALATGEVIGQVASQTLENMSVISAVARRPILRPLIGLDKEEIVAEAERLGTYPTSIIPDEDCCTLFTPRHPATRARAYEVEQAERTLPIAEMTNAAFANATLERFRYPESQNQELC